jgi:hypothetical protein
MKANLDEENESGYLSIKLISRCYTVCGKKSLTVAASAEWPLVLTLNTCDL